MARRGITHNRINEKKNTSTSNTKVEYTYIFKVKERTTLLEFLLLKLNSSRNVCKSLLSKGMVLLNGSVAKQFDTPLAKEDEIKILKHPLKGVSNNSNNKDTKKINNSFNKLNIIYEDDDFIAIDKPAGLLSIESDKNLESAYDYVYKYLSNKDKKLRPFVIHRIDKETSGVLVFAKNEIIQGKLRLNWNKYVKLREYVALVKGLMPKQSDRIISYLREDDNNMVYVARSNDGKEAITNYKVIKTNESYSLLHVEIETGRKNQIRVVLAAMGNPIVGDTKYGDNIKLIDRLGLHASKLEFIHPITKEVISISAKLPQSFNSVFKK